MVWARVAHDSLFKLVYFYRLILRPVLLRSTAIMTVDLIGVQTLYISVSLNLSTREAIGKRASQIGIPSMVIAKDIIPIHAVIPMFDDCK